MNDTDLLQEYLRNRSESAFAELVRRYVDFVHSTARRQVADDSMAEEVTQKVFCLLAVKARRLTGHRALGGWLYRATCFTAAKATRAEQRRRKHEQEMANMEQETSGTDDVWTHLAPLLDDALNQLTEQDRLAVLLRFFQKKPMRAVGLTLGISEAAAKMRVSRSIERLRGFFAKRGIACTSTALTLLLAEKSISAAPAGLTGKISKKAVAGAAGTVSLWQAGLLLGRFMSLKVSTIGTVGLGLLAVFTAGMQLYTYSLGEKISQEQNSGSVEGVAQVGESHNSPRISRLGKGNGITSVTKNSVNVDELVAKLRAALADTNSSVVPGIDVVNAVKAFSTQGDAAFDVLEEVAATHDEKSAAFDVSQLAPHRAITGMGFLGKSVPKAAPFLWDVFQTSEKKTESVGYLGLIGLHQIGFEAPDIALLAERVLTADYDEHSDAFVKSQVASWIAETIKTNPVAAQPYVPAVEKLLDNPDAGIRFWAAGALIEHTGMTNPKVYAEINVGLKNADKERLAWVSESLLKGMGAPAKPIVPALLAAAQAMNEEPARSWAMLAVGNIDADARTVIPEVDTVLTADEKDKAWLDKINSGAATMDELLPALRKPESASVAAMLLGNMGPAASNALPEMMLALQTQKETGHLNDMIVAIRKIDPQAALAPEDLEPIMTSIFESLNQNKNMPSEAVMDSLANCGAWCTRQGVGDFAKKLSAQDQKAGLAFTAAVLAKKPNWNELLQQQP